MTERVGVDNIYIESITLSIIFELLSYSSCCDTLSPNRLRKMYPVVC